MTTKSITIKIDGDAKGLNIAIDDGEQGLKNLGDAAEDAGGGLSSMGSKLKDFASGALQQFTGGALLDGVKMLGGKLMDAFGDAMQSEVITDRLGAQLGGSAQFSEEMGAIAGRLYGNAYGDSLADTAAAVKQVWQQGVGTLFGEDDSAEVIEGITASAMDLATAFDQDLNPVVNAASQMVKTGLAANADEAFDILTRGFQEGADKAEDLLDTMNEYGTQFREVGLDGSTAMGLITQALHAGARDADVAADAIKEFGIRSKDGSTASAEGFKALGLNAQEMTKVFAAGGKGAADGLDLVLDKLRGMTDPVQRNAAAVALFGTQAEDLGDALFAMDPSQAVDALGNVGGAADRMGTMLNDNAAAKLESFKRSMQMNLTNFMKDNVLPGVVEFGDRFVEVFNRVKDVVAVFFDAFRGDAPSADIGSLTEPITTLGVAMRQLADEWIPQVQNAFNNVVAAIMPFWNAINGNQNALITLGIILGTVLLGAVIGITVALFQMAIAVVAATWPFIAIAAAIFGLVVGLRYAYENWGWFRDGVNAVVTWLQTNVPPIIEAVRAAIGTAFTWVATVAVPFITNAFASFMGFLQNTLLPVAQQVWNNVVNQVQTMVNFVSPIISFLVDVISQNFGHIAEIARNIWDMISNIISNAWQIISNIIQLGLNLISGNWGAAWDNVKNIASAVWNTIQNIVANGIGILREALQGLASFIGNLGGRMWEGISSGFRSVINSVIDKWNSLRFTLPSIDAFGMHLGGGTIAVPSVPRFQGGGIFHSPPGTGAGLAILHDGERVLPRAMAGRNSMGNVPVVINVPQGFVGSEDALARVFNRMMRSGQRAGVRMPWEVS